MKDQIYLFMVLGFSLAMLLEALVPRRQLQAGLFWRWINNFSLAMVTWYISALFSTSFILYLASLTQARPFGLLPLLGVGTVVSFVVLLVVSQFINYWVHVAFHKIPWLWPIHAVHHTDVDVDVSTSYRHHPLEPLVSLPLYVPAILLLGVPLDAAMAFKLIEIGMTLFSHSNIRIPQIVERQLRRVIITPDFHRLHHCSQQRYTDSNYGSIVPWFDYLFGTASSRPYVDQETMELGLDYSREPKDARLDKLLSAPLCDKTPPDRHRVG